MPYPHWRGAFHLNSGFTPTEAHDINCKYARDHAPQSSLQPISTDGWEWTSTEILENCIPKDANTGWGRWKQLKAPFNFSWEIETQKKSIGNILYFMLKQKPTNKTYLRLIHYTFCQTDIQKPWGLDSKNTTEISPHLTFTIVTQQKTKQVSLFFNCVTHQSSSRKRLWKLTVMFSCLNILTGFNKIPEFFLTFFW